MRTTITSPYMTPTARELSNEWAYGKEIKMNTALKLKIEEAIQGVIDDTCEDSLWDGYIDPALVTRMTDAAALVFDTAMIAQEFAKEQDAP